MKHAGVAMAVGGSICGRYEMAALGGTTARPAGADESLPD
jgi:hypothetical protein